MILRVKQSEGDFHSDTKGSAHPRSKKEGKMGGLIVDPISGIIVPLTESRLLCGVDALGVDSGLDEGGVSAEGQHFDIGISETLDSFGELIIEQAYAAEQFAGAISYHLSGTERSATGGNNILDDDHLLINLKVALDKILEAMIFGRGSNINEGERQDVSHEHTERDSGSGNRSDYLNIRESLAHDSRHLDL